MLFSQTAQDFEMTRFICHLKKTIRIDRKEVRVQTVLNLLMNVLVHIFLGWWGLSCSNLKCILRLTLLTKTYFKYLLSSPFPNTKYWGTWAHDLLSFHLMCFSQPTLDFFLPLVANQMRLKMKIGVSQHLKASGGLKRSAFQSCSIWNPLSNSRIETVRMCAPFSPVMNLLEFACWDFNDMQKKQSSWRGQGSIEMHPGGGYGGVPFALPLVIAIGNNYENVCL